VLPGWALICCGKAWLLGFLVKRFDWEIAEFGPRGSSGPMALTRACVGGPSLSLTHGRVSDILFAAIIVSHPGLIVWKSIGENTVRDIRQL
jgi:hypothetical protein